MNLFRLGEFTLSSGRLSRFKIDCDVLADADLEALALMLSGVVDAFAFAIGVPTGGERLAQALNRKHRMGGSTTLLLVDDVLTTGESLNKMKHLFDSSVKVKGAVLFARGKCPDWVTPLFRMTGEED